MTIIKEFNTRTASEAGGALDETTLGFAARIYADFGPSGLFDLEHGAPLPDPNDPVWTAEFPGESRETTIEDRT